MPFVMQRKMLEQKLGREKIANRIAQEFQTLIVAYKGEVKSNEIEPLVDSGESNFYG